MTTQVIIFLTAIEISFKKSNRNNYNTSNSIAIKNDNFDNN